MDVDDCAYVPLAGIGQDFGMLHSEVFRQSRISSLRKAKKDLTRREFLHHSACGLALAVGRMAVPSKATGAERGRRIWAATDPAPQLIPERPGGTPSYWCTWDEQASTMTRPGGQLTATRHLNETLVFKDPGWITHYWQKVRKDLFVLYDGGWDIPLNVDYTGQRSWQLGSQEVAVDKFPSCTGAPAARLRKLNEMTQEAGWRGAGIWVAAQAYGDGKDGKLLTQAQVLEYLRERARWSHEAGIGYWKVDFGARENTPGFRRLMTDICRQEAPGLVVEHAQVCGPVNDEPCPWDKTPRVCHYTGRYAPWDNGRILAGALELLRFSATLRTYDVIMQFRIPSTLDRVADLVSRKQAHASGNGGIVLCEDQVYIGAGLGCAMGILRGPHWIQLPGQDNNPYHIDSRLDEAVRAVRWQRLAPAFPAWQVEAHLDSQALTDDWYFKEGETNATWLFGHVARQGAPARVSRGMPLPEVRTEGEPPFVIASRHPNGAVAVATLQRASKERGIYMPLADVAIVIGDGDSPVGIFGEYRSLGLTLSQDLGARRLWAQDLAGEAPVDITAKVGKHGRTLTMSGELIRQVGRAAASPGDISNPGLVLKLI